MPYDYIGYGAGGPSLEDEVPGTEGCRSATQKSPQKIAAPPPPPPKKKIIITIIIRIIIITIIITILTIIIITIIIVIIVVIVIVIVIIKRKQKTWAARRLELYKRLSVPRTQASGIPVGINF